MEHRPVCVNCGARAEAGRSIERGETGWLCHWCGTWGQIACPTCGSTVRADQVPAELVPRREPFDIERCPTGPCPACGGRGVVRVA